MTGNDDEMLAKKQIAAWSLLRIVVLVLGVVLYFVFSSSNEDGKITIHPPGQ